MLTNAQKDALYGVIGSRIRLFRGKQLSQQRLAELSGLSRASISNIEAGRHRVPLHQLLQIAQALNKPLNDLIPRWDEIAGTEAGPMTLEVVGQLSPELRKLMVTNLGGQYEFSTTKSDPRPRRGSKTTPRAES